MLRDSPLGGLGYKPAPQVLGQVLANPPFFLWIGGEIPAEGLVEEGAIEVEAGFDQVTVGGSRRDRPGH